MMEMTNWEQMVDYIAKACKIALGEEWDNMSDNQKHDTIMGFIAKAAQNAQ